MTLWRHTIHGDGCNNNRSSQNFWTALNSFSSIKEFQLFHQQQLVFPANTSFISLLFLAFPHNWPQHWLRHTVNRCKMLTWRSRCQAQWTRCVPSRPASCREGESSGLSVLYGQCSTCVHKTSNRQPSQAADHRTPTSSLRDRNTTATEWLCDDMYCRLQQYSHMTTVSMIIKYMK